MGDSVNGYALTPLILPCSKSKCERPRGKTGVSGVHSCDQAEKGPVPRNSACLEQLLHAGQGQGTLTTVPYALDDFLAAASTDKAVEQVARASFVAVGYFASAVVVCNLCLSRQNHGNRLRNTRGFVGVIAELVSLQSHPPPPLKGPTAPNLPPNLS